MTQLASPTQPDNNDRSSFDAWRESRSGARAARGFHYQHLVSTLILVRQWAGLAPVGNIVPEGFEDCVIESQDHITWIQAKSRNHGTFREAEVRRILTAVATKTARFSGPPDIRTAVVLEQLATGFPPKAVDHLFEEGSEKVLLCSSPTAETLGLLSKQLNIAPVIAEGLLSELYKLVADVSAANAAASFDNRTCISTTDVELRILKRLEAEDPSAIDEAITTGCIAPVDFATPRRRTGLLPRREGEAGAPRCRSGSGP